jgi:hypothetical protein
MLKASAKCMGGRRGVEIPAVPLWVMRKAPLVEPIYI